VAAATIFDFGNHEILLADGIQRKETYHYTMPNFVEIGQSIMVLSHLDVLASVCLCMNKLANTLMYVE